MRHLPNLICLLRIALIGPTLVALRAGAYPLALALFVAAAVSDGLDGYLAKRFGWTSDLGRFLDPLADKLLLVALFVQCAWLALVPLAHRGGLRHRRGHAVGEAILRRVAGDIGERRGRPTLISKVNTAAQLLYLMLVLLAASVQLPPREILDACALIALTTTVVSGAHYMRTFAGRAWMHPARP
jgi:cardiolipin synthase